MRLCWYVVEKTLERFQLVWHAAVSILLYGLRGYTALKRWPISRVCLNLKFEWWELYTLLAILNEIKTWGSAWFHTWIFHGFIHSWGLVRLCEALLLCSSLKHSKGCKSIAWCGLNAFKWSIPIWNWRNDYSRQEYFLNWFFLLWITHFAHNLESGQNLRLCLVSDSIGVTSFQKPHA